MCHHAIQIIEHIASRNPKRLKTDISKYGVPSEIAVRTVAH